MLKWERPHLLFVEKCSIFAFAKEETVRSRRLPPFLSPACAQNYPALAKNYKALGFIYVLFGEKHKALGGNAPAGDRKNPAQKVPLGKFMLNLLMHFDALSLMQAKLRRHWWRWQSAGWQGAGWGGLRVQRCSTSEMADCAKGLGNNCCPVKVFSDKEIDGYETPVSGVPAGKKKTGINPLRRMQNVSCEPWTLYPSENPSSKLGCFQTATSSPCRVLHPSQGDKQNNKPFLCNSNTLA